MTSLTSNAPRASLGGIPVNLTSADYYGSIVGSYVTRSDLGTSQAANVARLATAASTGAVAVRYHMDYSRVLEDAISDKIYDATSRVFLYQGLIDLSTVSDGNVSSFLASVDKGTQPGSWYKVVGAMSLSISTGLGDWVYVSGGDSVIVNAAGGFDKVDSTDPEFVSNDETLAFSRTSDNVWNARVSDSFVAAVHQYTDNAVVAYDATNSLNLLSLSTSISDVSSSLSSATTSLSTAIADASTSLSTAIADASTSLSTSIADASTSLSTAVGDVSTSLSALGTDVASSITAINLSLADLSGSVSTLVADTSAGLASSLTSLATDLSNATTSLSTAIGDVSSSFTTALGDASTSLSTAIGDVSTSFTTALGDASTSLSTAIGDASASLSTAIGSASTSVSSAATAKVDTTVVTLRNRLAVLEDFVRRMQAYVEINSSGGQVYDFDATLRGLPFLTVSGEVDASALVYSDIAKTTASGWAGGSINGTLAIPDGVSLLQWSLNFFNMKSFTSVIIPSSLQTIAAAPTDSGNGTFQESGIQYLDTKNVTSLTGWYGALGTPLQSLTANNVLSIGPQWFQNTTLNTVTLPSVQVIDSLAFYGCTNLTTVTLPSVTSIGASAFAECSSLTTVFAPASATIADNAFNNCPLFTTVTFV